MELAATFQVGEQTTGSRLEQVDLDAGRRNDGEIDEERVKLSKLRRDSKRLAIEMMSYQKPRPGTLGRPT